MVEHCVEGTSLAFRARGEYKNADKKKKKAGKPASTNSVNIGHVQQVDGISPFAGLRRLVCHLSMAAAFPPLLVGWFFVWRSN